jgi:hypothetical protein
MSQINPNLQMAAELETCEPFHESNRLLADATTHPHAHYLTTQSWWEQNLLSLKEESVDPSEKDSVEPMDEDSVEASVGYSVQSSVKDKPEVDMKDYKTLTEPHQGKRSSAGVLKSRIKKVVTGDDHRDSYFERYQKLNSGQNVIGEITSEIKERLVGPHVTICKYLILGMGSVNNYVGDDPSKDASSEMAIAQYHLALQKSSIVISDTA